MGESSGAICVLLRPAPSVNKAQMIRTEGHFLPTRFKRSSGFDTRAALTSSGTYPDPRATVFAKAIELRSSTACASVLTRSIALAFLAMTAT